jgi:hypothetical protein
MPANDHLHPEQLKLFMTGTELKGAITNSIDRNPIGGFGRSMDQMWDTKRKESKRTGVGHGHGTHASIKEHGWVGPGPDIFQKRTYGAIPEFDKDDFQVSDAHHRIAAAADIEAKTKGTKKPRTIWIPTTNRSEYPSLTRSEQFGKFNQDQM